MPIVATEELPPADLGDSLEVSRDPLTSTNEVRNEAGRENLETVEPAGTVCGRCEVVAGGGHEWETVALASVHFRLWAAGVETRPCDRHRKWLPPEKRPGAPSPTVSGLVTKREPWRLRNLKPRTVVYLDWVAGKGHGIAGGVVDWPARCDLGELVAGVPVGVDTVSLVGDVAAAVLEEWATVAAPAGWVSTGHYLDRRRASSVLRFAAREGQRAVSVTCAQQWVGGGVEAWAAAQGMRLAGDMIADEFGGGVLMATPATTGRYLLSASLPDGHEFPVLSDEVAELIRSTSTQHRMELVAEAGVEVPRMIELDARLAYAALTWGLPVGEPMRVTGEPAPYDEQRRGRYLVSFAVPDDWAHVGVLPVLEGDRWRWPRAGEHTSWIDGAELRLARRYGWSCTVHESLIWPAAGADPLKGWAAHLLAAAERVDLEHKAGRIAAEVHEAARHAVRAVVLHSIGALHGSAGELTHVVDLADVPAGMPWRPLPGTYTGEGQPVAWIEHRPPAWPAMVHPEWSSAIWARMRCRLLDGPKGSGVIGPDPERPRISVDDVIGFRGDAIYLTHDPRWVDDGAAGRFRPKGTLAGPLEVPANLADLDALRGAGIGHARHGLEAARRQLQRERAGE